MSQCACMALAPWSDVTKKAGTSPRARARGDVPAFFVTRSEEHTSELQSQSNIVCRLLLEKKTHSPTPPAILRTKCMNESLLCAGSYTPTAIPQTTVTTATFHFRHRHSTVISVTVGPHSLP